MRTFEDLNTRKWNIEITVGTVKRIRSSLKINILDLGDEGFIESIVNDPELMVDMFWIILEDQAKKYEISEKDFGEGFGGDAIENAVIAFTEALTDFFPKAKREVVSRLFAKTNALTEKGFARILAEVENLDEEAILNQTFQKHPLNLPLKDS